MCPTTSQYPSCWHPSWLSNPCTTRKDSESEWLAKDNQEANPTTIKPETASHVAKHFSWVPLVCSLLPSNLFPNKISCFVSSYVSLDNSFPSVKQEPTRAHSRVPLPATLPSIYFMNLILISFPHSFLPSFPFYFSVGKLIVWCKLTNPPNISPELQVDSPRLEFMTGCWLKPWLHADQWVLVKWQVLMQIWLTFVLTTKGNCHQLPL